MRVRVHELKEGSILSADVFSGTNRPLIPKKTVLSAYLIDFLKAFSIREVEIERTRVNGLSVSPVPDDPEAVSGGVQQELPALGMSDLFLKAVSEFKKEFISWQSGSAIDIGKVRGLLFPLLEKLDESPEGIFNLHHYSNKEDYLFQHSVAVGILSGFIGKKLNLSKGEWVQIAFAGILADCGMSKISPSILNKKTSLTLSEYEEVKKHPVLSYKLVQHIPVLRKEAKVAVLQHHERLDGSGYMLGETEKKIHFYAKIIAVADTYHAMTSERLYMNKQSPYKVIEKISEDCFGEFDITIVNALRSGMVNFSVGSRLKLSNNTIAEVLYLNESALVRPLLKVVETGEIIDLQKHRNLFIEEHLS